jgi:small subunit ribosomal protein S9
VEKAVRGMLPKNSLGAAQLRKLKVYTGNEHPHAAQQPKTFTRTITVNGRELAEYFPNKLHQQLINDPFTILDLAGGYDVIARISGGGPSGQAGALRLGIARALNQIDEENNRATLKKAGFLSRDARVKERKKAGLKKARKAPQFSKR